MWICRFGVKKGVVYVFGKFWGIFYKSR